MTAPSEPPGARPAGVLPAASARRREPGEVLTVTAQPEQAGVRADKVVVELLAAAGQPTPRAEVQRWMREGLVVAGEQVLAPKTLVKAGTSLTVTIGAAPLTRAEPDPSIRFDVVYEDDHLLVLDKPAGLVVHPARGHRTGTLVNGLLARGGFAADTADPRDPEGHLRPGIVHRLDKDTSGLMVVAKDAPTREGLKTLLAAHDVERSYLAITLGDTGRASFDTTHGRHPRHRLRFTSTLPADRPGVRRACTHVEPLQRLEGATLVRCTLETGRTHQIRVHLAEQARTPILADPLYGKRPAGEALQRIGDALGRQALHAEVLGFVHPVSGQVLRWQRPLPEDIQHALDELTKRST